MRKKGFTLIELLVVIAIIAVLASILFPAFGRAREKGRQATCASNLKQIGHAISMYMNDYDDYLPPMQVSGVGIWEILILPYCGINKTRAVRPIFECPSAYEEVSGKKVAGNSVNLEVSGMQCYGINEYLVWPAFGLKGGLTSTPAHDSQIAKPAETLLVADSYTSSNSYYIVYYGAQYSIQLSSRHSGGSNVLYCDSHVAYAPLSAASTCSKVKLFADASR